MSNLELRQFYKLAQDRLEEVIDEFESLELDIEDEYIDEEDEDFQEKDDLQTLINHIRDAYDIASRGNS